MNDVRIWSPRPQSRQQFIDDMSPHVPVPIVAAESAEAAVRDADLIVLATSSKTPVVESAWVGQGAHVMCVGACRPDQREMAPELVQRSRLYVDSRAAALVESGDVVMNIAEGCFDASHVRGEIGELVLGRVAGRTERCGRDDLQVAGHGGRRRRRRGPRVSTRLGNRRGNGADLMNGEQPQKKRRWMPIVIGILVRRLRRDHRRLLLRRLVVSPEHVDHRA